ILNDEDDGVSFGHDSLSPPAKSHNLGWRRDGFSRVVDRKTRCYRAGRLMFSGKHSQYRPSEVSVGEIARSCASPFYKAASVRKGIHSLWLKAQARLYWGLNAVSMGMGYIMG